MSHFKILNTISSLPALLWGSPLHLGDLLFSWSEGTKSLLGRGIPEGLCLPPTEPDTMPIRWVPPGLGLKLLPCFPQTARGMGGTWGTAPSLPSHPAAVLSLGTGRASLPHPSRGWWEPLGTTPVMAGTHWGDPVPRGARPPPPSCPSCAIRCRCPLHCPQPQPRPFPSLNPPALSPILLGSPSPIAASLN